MQATSEKIERDKGEKEVGEWNEVASAEAAFLGPQLWEKPLHCNTELKMELLDLDDFLKENDIDEDLLNQSFKAETSETFKNNLYEDVSSSQRTTTTTTGSTLTGGRESRQISPSLSFDAYQESETSSEASGSSYANDKKYWMSNSQQDSFETPTKSLRKHSSKSNKDYSSCKHPNEKRAKCSTRPSSCNSIDYPTSLLGEEEFDPRTRVFSDDELKPQQMIKKSKKKQLVPSDLKDEKYWARRQKNNVAAKRSRDARRTKENQIAMRARYLEKENQNLKMELQETLLKLESMKRRLAEYETT